MSGIGLSVEQADLVESIARRVVELLDERGAPARVPRLVTAAQLAAALAVDRSFVYAHAEELGAVRLPSPASSRTSREGAPKPRLRFDLDRARAALACYSSERSHPDEPSNGGGSGASEAGRSRRARSSAVRLPEPERVLAVRPRMAGQ